AAREADAVGFALHRRDQRLAPASEAENGGIDHAAFLVDCLERTGVGWSAAPRRSSAIPRGEFPENREFNREFCEIRAILAMARTRSRSNLNGLYINSRPSPNR